MWCYVSNLFSGITFWYTEYLNEIHYYNNIRGCLLCRMVCKSDEYILYCGTKHQVFEILYIFLNWTCKRWVSSKLLFVVAKLNLYIMYNSSYLLHASLLYHIFISIPWLMLWLNPMWNILLNWNVTIRSTRERKQVEFYIVVLTFVCISLLLWKSFGKVFFIEKIV